MLKRTALLVTFALAVSACSGSEDGGGAGTGGVDLSEFDGYCTGTLLADFDVQIAVGSGSWRGGSQDAFNAPKGTAFLVSPAFGDWEGYIAYADGKAARIDSDFMTGLVKDQDFTSDCATDVDARGVEVLMKDSTFYADEALSGDSCTLPAGTVLEQFSFFGGSDVANVSAAAIKAECGWDTAYSDDVATAELLPE